MAEEKLVDRPDGEGLPDEPDWALWDAEEQSKKLPAQYINRIYAKPDGSLLRFTLGEQVGDEVVYRAAFAIPIVTALEMGDLLTRMGSAQIQAQIQSWRDWVAANPGDTQSNG